MDGAKNNYLSNNEDPGRQTTHFLSYADTSIDCLDMCVYVGVPIEAKKLLKDCKRISREGNRMQVV